MLGSSQLRILIFLLVGGESVNEDNDIDVDGDDAGADDDVDCKDE